MIERWVSKDDSFLGDEHPTSGRRGSEQLDIAEGFDTRQHFPLQQLQTSSASCAHMTDLVFCIPLGTAGCGVSPTWI